MEELDPRYLVPSRYIISKRIDKILVDLKGNIVSHISKARKINFCTDIWSKEGMTAFYWNHCSLLL